MKKLFMLTLALLVICAALVSCQTHKHDSYENDDTYHWNLCNVDDCPVAGLREHHLYTEFGICENGDKQYTCTVCGHKHVEVHTHTYSDKYTSNEGKHWLECTVEGCIYITEKENHEWSFTKITKEPTVDDFGEELYTCDVCGKTKTKKLSTLVAGMSQEQWKNSFLFNNVRIDYVNDYGEYSETTYGYTLVDGETVLDVMGDGSDYLDRSVLAMMDFSENYDDFTYSGNGIYSADKVLLVYQGVAVTLSNVVISFEDENIDYIQYSINMGASLGVWKQEFYFSLWGEVTIKAPEDLLPDEMLTSDEWDEAFAYENLCISYSIYYIESEKRQFGELLVIGDTVYDKPLDGETTKLDRSVLWGIVDFSRLYQNFSFRYNSYEKLGIYYCSGHYKLMGDESITVNDIYVYISVETGRIEQIEYTIQAEDGEYIYCSYVLVNYGEVTPPKYY